MPFPGRHHSGDPGKHQDPRVGSVDPAGGDDRPGSVPLQGGRFVPPALSGGRGLGGRKGETRSRSRHDKRCQTDPPHQGRPKPAGACGRNPSPHSAASQSRRRGAVKCEPVRESRRMARKRSPAPMGIVLEPGCPRTLSGGPEEDASRPPRSAPFPTHQGRLDGYLPRSRPTPSGAAAPYNLRP